MSQTTYPRNTAAAVAGMPVLGFESDTVSCVALEDIPPGRLVVWNPAGSGGVQLPQGTTFTKPVGFSTFDPTRMQSLPGGAVVYKAGDQVPVMRSGRMWVEFNGGTAAAYTNANVKHSSTIATHRGKLTQSATSAGAGTEISNPGPVGFASLEGPTGLVQMDCAFPGQITNDDARLDALEADAATTNATVPVHLGAAVDIATGALCAVFADGASSTPGTQYGAPSSYIRWNNHATPGAIGLVVPMPQDLDDAADVVVHALVSKSGATVGDATKLTIGAFEIVPAALFDADADMGGDTGAVVGNAAAKTVTHLTLTLTAANIHAQPEGLALTIKPKAGTLGTDDLLLHSVWVSYTRKIQTS